MKCPFTGYIIIVEGTPLNRTFDLLPVAEPVSQVAETVDSRSDPDQKESEAPTRSAQATATFNRTLREVSDIPMPPSASLHACHQ